MNAQEASGAVDPILSGAISIGELPTRATHRALMSGYFSVPAINLGFGILDHAG